uniref:USP domain-containing protein n=1 Tax=Trichogramma kaykai TaxID=54128 RepID=A0ABD2XAB8_9HYME
MESQARLEPFEICGKKAFCSVCSDELEANSMKKHLLTMKHRKNEIKLNSAQDATAVDEKTKNKLRPSRNVNNIDEWMNLPEFSEWLKKSDEHEDKAFCTFCNEDLSPRKDFLRNHADTKKHKTNRLYLYPSELSDLERNVLITEIALSAMISSSNAPFLFIDTLVPVMKKLLPDSDIMKNVSLDRTKAKEIVNRILAPEEKKRLTYYLKSQKFSIIIDESTDRSLTHCLGIIVRFYDNELEMIVEPLWDLIDIYDKEDSLANAEQLTQKIIDSFVQFEIPLENMYGFCADTCALMMARENSVSALLKKKIPHLVITKCPCHMEQLCVKYAMKKLPELCKDFMTEVVNYISSSDKKTAMWRHTQERANLTPLKIVKPGFTRWISLKETVDYVLFRWTALTNFFKKEKQTEGKAMAIYENFQDKTLKLFLIFLQNILVPFTKVNVIMQSVTRIITPTGDQMRNLLQDTLCLFMKKDVVMNSSNLKNLNPECQEDLKNLKDMQVGEDVINYLMSKDNHMSEKEEITFLKTCQQVLIEVSKQLQNRLQLEETIISNRFVFHPENALSLKFRQKYPDLNSIFETYAGELSDSLKKAINDEWKLLPTYDVTINYSKLDCFWTAINYIVDDKNKAMFSNLSSYVLLSMVTVANSNASSERVWSKMNLIKTLLRCKLTLKNMQALIMASELVTSQGGIQSFIPSESMIKESIIIKSRYPTSHPANKFIELFSPDVIIQCKKDEIMFKPKKNNHINLQIRHKFLYFLASEPPRKKLKSDVFNHLNGTNVAQNVEVMTGDVSYSNISVFIPSDYVLGEDATEQITDRYIHPSETFNKSAFIAKYETANFNKLNKHKKDYHPLMAIEYSTLHGESYVEGSVIDSYMLSSLSTKNWKNIFFYPTSLTKFILGELRNNIQPSDFFGFDVELEFPDIVFMPYCYATHWMLLILNLKSKTICHLDPFPGGLFPNENRTAFNMLTQYFRKYLTLKPKTINNLVNIDWEMDEIPAILPKQKDSYNCGIFIIYYMNIIAKDESANLNFNADTYRNIVAQFLMENTLPMDTMCLGCLSTKSKLQYECRKCHRKVHSKCKIDYFSDNFTCKYCYSPDDLTKQRDMCKNKKISTAYIGFPNPAGSNSCWMNSALQILFLLPLFRDITKLQLKSCPWLFQKLEEVKKCLKGTQTQKNVLWNRLSEFKENLILISNREDNNFSSNRQQDVLEFFDLFLKYAQNEIVFDISSFGTDHTYTFKIDVFEKTFQITYQLPYTCSNCKRIQLKEIKTNFLHCFLPIDTSNECHLRNLLQTNYLSEDGDMLYCEQCRSIVHHSPGKKCFLHCPEILIISIQRCDDKGGKGVKKINTPLEHDAFIEIDGYIQNRNKADIEQCSYFLLGIICHESSRTDYGHYTSYVRRNDDTWTLFDDSIVKNKTALQVSNETKNNSYMLFYKRQI